MRFTTSVEQDGQRTALVFEDGQKLFLSKADAAGLHAGETVILRGLPEGQDIQESQAQARVILNELLKPDA